MAAKALTGSIEEMRRARALCLDERDQGRSQGTLTEFDLRELLGVPVRVCSLTKLREMKEAQGREQDRADLANLPED